MGLIVPATPHRIFAGLASGLALALLAGLVFTIDTPLKSDSAVTPTVIEKAAAAIRARGWPAVAQWQPGCVGAASSLYIAPGRPECSSAW